MSDRYEPGSGTAKIQPVARWESEGGAHWVDLHAPDELGFSSYKAGSGDRETAAGTQGGNHGTPDENIAEMQRMVDKPGLFQPDKNKKPMKRVI